MLEEVWPWGAAAAGDPPWGRGAAGSKGQRRTRSKRRTGTTHRPPPSACGALPHLAEGTGRKGTQLGREQGELRWGEAFDFKPEEAGGKVFPSVCFPQYRSWELKVFC